MAIALNIPSQIEKYLSVAFFPATGNEFTLYIANDTNRLYQWNGAAYVEVSQQDAVNWGSIGGNIINQTDLQLALAGKVDIEAGKGLSTNDYTTAEKNKLAGIEAGAEVNVNADWNATSGDAQILNKPTIPSTAGLVPYTGATSNVDLGEYQIKAGQLELDQTPTDTTGIAKIRWNDTDGTIDVGLKGGNVTLQVGLEELVRVVNKSGASLAESAYQAVRVRLVSEGGAAGQRLAVVLAQANNDLNSATTIGIVTETIANNQEGFINRGGEVRGINTTGSLQGETWVDGDILYLSPTTPGALTNIKPTAPDHSITIGYVVYSHAVNGKIFVKVDNGYELEELHNILITAPTNRQSLMYEAATQLWKNETIEVPVKTMTIVSCGNSISVQNQAQATGAAKGLQLANILSGSPFEWKRMTASTRTDIYGTYGYSGATLETILGDIEAQWFTPLATANIIPDIAYGYALLENDLIQNRTFNQMKSSLNAWVATVKNRWQGVKILLNTPHPTTGYNTTAIKERFTQISDYIMSLDNGVDIFCTKLDGYLSPTNIGNPIINTINGSISGTTLTVVSTDANINRSDIISVGAYSGRVTAYGTGTGGAGTYTVDTSGIVPITNINLNKYASDGVHPNETGSLVNARTIKNTIARLGSVWKRNYIGFSNNMPVYGSIAAQSPGVGTIATGMDTSILPAGNTYLFEAQLPSVQETCTVPFSAGPNYPAINWFGMGSIAVSGVTQMSPFLVFEIIEGAENVKFIQLQARVNDGGGNTFQQFINPNTNSTEMTWQNGDKVTVVYPPIIANSGSITALQNYVVLITKLKGGTVKYRILSQGYYKIA